MIELVAVDDFTLTGVQLESTGVPSATTAAAHWFGAGAVAGSIGTFKIADPTWTARSSHDCA